MIGMQKLAVLHAELKIGLSGSKYSPVLCLPARAAVPDCWGCENCDCGTRRYTRLRGMQKLLAPHAELKAGLSGSKCSPVLCLPSAAGQAHTFPFPAARLLPALSPYHNIVRGYGGCAHMITNRP